jgi:hypothetical protein
MRVLFTILLFFPTLICFSQIPVWQGFELNWTYNHRLNRLGSYVYKDSVYTTAATGSGKDSASFNTHYLLIPQSGKQYSEFEILKRIEAKENELINIQIDTMIIASFHRSIFYLNGFDIIANNDADKLQMMDFSVKMIKGNEDTTYLRINISLMFNCQSLECDWVNNDVDYDLHLYIGNISFPNEDYISYVKGEMFNGNESWTRKINLPPNKLQGDPNTPQFITSMKISLDKAHWFSGIFAYVDNGNGTVMKFEQYKSKMKKNAYYKPHANFSKRSMGTANYQMDGIALTHPGKLKRDPKEFKGSIIWKGNNRSAFSRDAIRSTSIR